MNIALMIALCAVVTMVPRMIPYFLSFFSRLPAVLRKGLTLLPIAALGALIFPMAMMDFGASWYAGLAGVIAAFIVSYFGGSMIIAIIISLASTALMLLI